MGDPLVIVKGVREGWGRELDAWHLVCLCLREGGDEESEKRKVRRCYLVYLFFQLVFLPVVSVSSLQCPNSSGQRKTAVSLLPLLVPPQEKYKK